jgi:hypothetical protein
MGDHGCGSNTHSGGGGGAGGGSVGGRRRKSPHKGWPEHVLLVVRVSHSELHDAHNRRSQGAHLSCRTVHTIDPGRGTLLSRAEVHLVYLLCSV